MINKSNIKKALISLGYVDNGNLLTKHFDSFDCDMIVDFENEQLVYPDSIRGRDRNTNFDQSENFVVFECVDRLLDLIFSTNEALTHSQNKFDIEKTYRLSI